MPEIVPKLLVKELSGPDQPLVGHVTLQTMKVLVGRGRLFTTQLSAYDPIEGVTLDVFRTEGGKGVAEFVAFFDVVDPEGNPILLPVKIKLVDGGEPPQGPDEEYYYLPGPTGWERYGGEGAASDTVSNVQIHLGE